MPHKSNLAEASQCIPYKLKAGCRWQMTSLRFNNAVSIGHIQHTLQPLTLAVMITCTFHAGGRVHVHVTIILSCFCNYSQTEMDLESHWCIVRKQNTLLSLCVGFVDAMLRSFYVLLTTVFQKQFCLTII